MPYPEAATGSAALSTPPGDDDPPDLVLRATRGDMEAFEQLYEQHVDPLYRYIHFRVRNHDDAENITQETWLRVARSIKTFEPRPGKTFAAWLVRIAQNLITDHYRGAARRREVFTSDLLALDAPSLAASPEEQAERRALAAKLTEILRRLPPGQRECATLRFYIGFTVGETAEILGRSEQSVKGLQRRALRHMGALASDLRGHHRGLPAVREIASAPTRRVKESVSKP